MEFVRDITYIHDMLTFVSVSESGGFSAAAELLGVSKSIVSKRLTRLELKLGVQLMHRTTRSVTLTELGKSFYYRCVDIKEDIERAVSSVTSDNLKPIGTLRINSPLSFSSLYLAPALNEFSKQHPQIKIDLMLGEQYKNLSEHDVDVSIRVGDLPDSTLMARKIMTCATKVCASPHYLKNHDNITKPTDLMSHNCLLHSSSFLTDNWRFKEKRNLTGVKVKGSLVANNSEALKTAAVAGMGIVRLPSYLIQDEIDKGQLESVLAEFCPGEFNVYAVYQPTRFVPPKIRLFIDFLVGYLSA